MVQVEDLAKVYGPTVALDGVSFEVERGEIVGLLGPNGAGKTTAMRILTCYMPATSGQAKVAGHDVFSDSLAVRRNVGYLPEGVPLYPEMRVREYLRYRARIKHVPAKQRKKRIEYVMDRCGVTEVNRKLIGSLSKGYRQRVGLAEALVHDPPVLILDEPTIGLDPNQIRQVRELIRQLGDRHTIILSTHILPEVEMVCSRVLIIHNGKLVFQDTLEAIRRQGETAMKVFVEVDAPRDNALNVFRDVPGVLGVKAEGEAKFRQYELTVKPDSDIRAAIFRRVVRNGWTLRELRREQPSLEDIFVRLTAKEDT